MQEEGEDQDEDACLVEPEDKPPPVMRHQWMRGSIDDSQVRTPATALLCGLLVLCHCSRGRRGRGGVSAASHPGNAFFHRLGVL